MLTLAHALNPLLMIALPILLGVGLTRRYRLDWSLFGWGALTFLVSQVMHIPFNQLLLEPVLVDVGFPIKPVGLAVGALLLGLSAGLFEEFARYLFLRRWVRAARTWQTGLLYGAGHGGFEAVLLGALAMYAFIQAVALRDADLTLVLEPAQIAMAHAQLEAYWTMQPGVALLGALERIFALLIQMSASLMVVLSVVRSRWIWLAAAILWHAAVDGFAVYLLQRFDVYTAEVSVFVMALLAVAFMVLARKSGWLPEVRGEPDVDQPGRSGSSRVGVDTDEANGRRDLEDSRYV